MKKQSLENIGTQIKLLRENSGFTQKTIANFLGVDQSLISKFEAGERPISADMLERLLTLFGCNMSMLIEATDEYKPLSLALRANEVLDEDLEAVRVINKIALNSAFMTKLLEREVR